MHEALTWILLDGKPYFLDEYLRQSAFSTQAVATLNMARNTGLVVRRLKVVDLYEASGQHHRDGWLLVEQREAEQITHLLLIRASDAQVLVGFSGANDDDEALDHALRGHIETLREQGTLVDSAMGWIRLGDLGSPEGLVHRLANKGMEAWWTQTGEGSFGWLALARYVLFTQRFHLRQRMRWKGKRWESITLFEETAWQLEASDARAKATSLG